MSTYGKTLIIIPTSCKRCHKLEDQVHFQQKTGVITELEFFYYYLIDTGKNLLLLFIALCFLEGLNSLSLSWYIYSSETPYYAIIITQR